MFPLALTLLTVTPMNNTDFLHDYAATRRFLAGRPVGAKLTPDGKKVLFLRSPPRDASQWLFELDVATGATRELLTPDALLKGAAQTLSAAEKAQLERLRVSARGFTSFQLSEDGARILVGLSGRLYVVERATGAVTELATGPGAAITPRFSRDGKKVAYVRGFDVYALDVGKNTERRLTRGGTEWVAHGIAEHVAQEEMRRYEGFWFSPDGKRLAFTRVDHSGVERFGIHDPLHPEVEPDRFFYPRPGKANAVVSLGLVSATGGKPVWATWDAKAFPYLATVVWPKAGPLTLVVQNRAQTREQVLAVDPKTGVSRVLLEESDDAWLNLDQAFPHWLEDGSGFFWRTERNGGPEVELRNSDGTLARSWVAPGAGFAEWVGFDDARRALFFTGGAEPTQALLYQVVEAGAVTPVKAPLQGPAVLHAKLGKGGDRLLVTGTNEKAMPRTWVMAPDGSSVFEVPSVSQEPSLSLRIEYLTVPGDQALRAAVIRPQGWKGAGKLPVVLAVYGGPSHQEVLHTLRENLVLQWLADQGFLVLKVEGRGTPRRGRAFERAIKHDFATVTVADQVEGLQAVGKRLPEADLTRVGVYGWSFGGYLAALLAMQRPDVFASAVAGAPVVDWLDYDSHYTERYLGLPETHPEAYRVSSLLSHVATAKRPLLLMHGTADDNVYFQHTLKLSDALFKAGKPHAVLPLSNFTHMVPEPLVTQRQWERIAEFFKQTLAAP